MSLVSLRESIRCKLSDEVKDFAQVYTHGGRFDVEELKRWSVKAPCAVVGALGINSIDSEAGQPVALVEWGAFIVTKDTADLKRDVSALGLVEALLGIVTPLERWGDDAAHVPTAIKATNLYGGQLDKTGIALWMIGWTQGYDLNRFDLSTLDNFLTYNSTTSLADAASDDTPSAEDTVSLTAWTE